jgi:hypothetical protein
MPRATSTTSSKVTASSAAIGVVRVDGLAEQDRLGRAVARHGVRVLEGQDAAAGGVRAGALDLLLARAVRVSSADDLLHPREGLDALARLQARPELQDGHVGEAWSAA